MIEIVVTSLLIFVVPGGFLILTVYYSIKQIWRKHYGKKTKDVA